MKSTYLTKNLTLLSVIALLLLSGCASIVSKTSYPISIKSNPSGADLSVVNGKGVEIYAGTTPADLKLDAGGGFFKKASYTATFEMNGYQKKTVPIEFKMDGWYMGNLLIGGFLGMLIIDPATGAMWKLDTEFLNETLPAATAHTGEPSMSLYTINEIPSHWKDKLIKIEK